jgi:hypothetical protein
VSEYKTKTIDVTELFPFPRNSYTLRRVAEALPEILQANDEDGWEVCSVITAQLIGAPPFEVVVVYRRIDEA